MRRRSQASSPASQTGIPLSGAEWRQVYERAIAEVDTLILPLRVAEARHAMLERAKEIFDRTEDEEFHALTNSLRTLCSLEDEAADERRAA